MAKRYVWLLLLISMGIGGPLAAAPEARTYQLNKRAAGDLAAQLRQLYPSTEASITAHRQQLVVRAEPSVLDEMGRLIETMDVAPLQLRITVRTSHQVQGARQQAGVTLRNTQPGVQVHQKTIATQRNHQQQLIMQDGQLAHISAGRIRRLPVVVQGGLHPAALYHLVDVRRGFVVQPMVISPRQVELNILAFDNIPELDAPGLESEALMTTRRVSPGEWVPMGSVQTADHASSSGLVYRTGGNHRENRSLQVRVDLL
ncbi:secretin N-terminal domain-containing protein [Marinobacter sp. X15-166B]|uniref:secretin N-terminal domain-containing protein n=1 Tax=Marinobacter sp. X15-166B TaxID=1897620 RepID=UPI00085C3A1D|nr:secretin N-terminal domain-containing protein [Marinobacter sp. X15-166B]OEY65706.1 hypothetical protein BG841_04030 [Marinobacter sp. X15-166B]